MTDAHIGLQVAHTKGIINLADGIKIAMDIALIKKKV
jgi:hypothetical protein